jgi:hypothetical protein
MILMNKGRRMTLHATMILDFKGWQWNKKRRKKEKKRKEKADLGGWNKTER